MCQSYHFVIFVPNMAFNIGVYIRDGLKFITFRLIFLTESTVIALVLLFFYPSYFYLYLLFYFCFLFIGFVLDNVDRSVTRSDSYFKELFRQCGLHLYKSKVTHKILCLPYFYLFVISCYFPIGFTVGDK